MADWVGSLQPGVVHQYQIPQSANITASKSLPAQAAGLLYMPSAIADGWEATGLGLVKGYPDDDWVGARTEGPSQFWFEHFMITPSIVELGNIVTTIMVDLEIYNSARDAAVSLTAAANNAGVGVSFHDFPGLPWAIEPQVGLIVQVQVLTDGPPNINGTLDFTLNVGSLQATITGTRVVIFAFEPEAPITETLDFLTNVIQARDGSEQRISPRKCPRQAFNFTLKLDGAQRRYFHSLLFGFQSGTFGVPVWFESKQLAVAATTGMFTIQVDTRWADFRVDGLAMVWTDDDTFDAQEIESMTDSSITFSSALLNNHAVGAMVMPLRLAVTQSTVGVNRHPMNLDEVVIKFQITDNDVDLADASAFDVHNGLVMLDGPNAMEGTIGDNLEHRLSRMDNLTGSVRQSSDWAGSHYNSTKQFECRTAAEVWAVRRLAHALRGSHVSFYLPTFYPDMVVTQSLTIGSLEMDIENIGYTSLVRNLEPNTSIWILLTNGSVLTRQVVSSVVIDTATERLTVDAEWAATITAASIQCISFLRLCRIADDRVTFLHSRPGDASVQMVVTAVQT